MIKCEFLSECANMNTDKCRKCEHNVRRNYVEDFFKEAKDRKIPKQCSKLTYKGPAEQTAGYCCPVCGNYTNPYQLVDGNCCRHCGYRLNI